MIDGASNLRRAPNRTASIITRWPEGTEFEVIDGPQCDEEGILWWEVRHLSNAQEGYIAELQVDTIFARNVGG